MKITTYGKKEIYIKKRRYEDAFDTNLFSEYDYVTTEKAQEYAICHSVMKLFKSNRVDQEYKLKTLNTIMDAYETTKLSDSKVDVTEKIEDAKSVIQQIINFFSEFEFEPNFRFLNTFAFAVANGTERDYIINYFKLIDNPCANSVIEKMKSYEFDNIVDNMKSFVPRNHINNRFKVYYGSAGTGKTTKAMKETDGNAMVCHSAMLPSDLMEDFTFTDGKAGFNPSALWRAMEEGKKIVLDEINLLPFESLRFLQGLLDGKTEFEYKGQTVYINPGFQVIGTMNLMLNGTAYSLPEPLIDRACELVEFKLTAENLVSAII